MLYVLGMMLGMMFLAASQGDELNTSTTTPAYQSGIEWAQDMVKTGVQPEKEGVPKKPCCHVSSTLKLTHDIPENHYLGSDKILIFVSFSMPLLSLIHLSEEISHEALSLGQSPSVTILIKGLIENSFKKTAHQMKELSASIDIDPQAFEVYQITKVPTFILIREGKELSRLSGNVSLSFAREKLQEAS